MRLELLGDRREGALEFAVTPRGGDVVEDGNEGLDDPRDGEIARQPAIALDALAVVDVLRLQALKVAEVLGASPSASRETSTASSTSASRGRTPRVRPPRVRRRRLPAWSGVMGPSGVSVRLLGVVLVHDLGVDHVVIRRDPIRVVARTLRRLLRG